MRSIIRKILKENEFDWLDINHLEGINNDLIEFLIRNYRVYQLPITHDLFPNKKYIIIDDKPRFIEDNKKYIINKIFLEVEGDFEYIPKPIIRRTIRSFLNDILGY